MVKESSTNVPQVEKIEFQNGVGHGSKRNCNNSNPVVSCEGPSRVPLSASGYKTRLFYNANVNPGDIEAILANRGRKHKKLVDRRVVKSMIFRGDNSAGSGTVSRKQCKESQNKDVKNTHIIDSNPTKSNGGSLCDSRANNPEHQPMLGQGGGESQSELASFRVTENAAFTQPPVLPKITQKIDYDSNHVGIEDKFISSILNESTKKANTPMEHNSALFRKWQAQPDFPFGYIPIDEQVMPTTNVVNRSSGFSPFSAHALVKATGKPNYMEARLPVPSQLNVETWKSLLTEY